MFPYPVVDKVRVNCATCIGACSGHYITNLENYMQEYSAGSAIRARPPSEILAEFFNSERTVQPSDTKLQELKNKCLLPADEIKVYLQHMATTAANREEGARKRKRCFCMYYCIFAWPFISKLWQFAIIKKTAACPS